ncbi:MAG: flippase [Candidatus Krumholzibacteriota bacterium]|nr:flippase [Candidatus Krumholzibacteriota bacterium]
MTQRSSRNDSLAAGYFWTFGSTAMPLLGAFIVSLIVARWMGPRIVGLINWTMAAATILLIPGKFGIDGAASRLISEYKVKAPQNIGTLLTASIRMRMLFTIPVAFATAVFAPQLARFFHEEALVPLFRISALMIFTVSFNELSVLLIIGLGKFRFLFAMRVLMFAIRVGVVIMAIRFAMGAEGVLAAYIIATLAAALIIFIYLFKTPETNGLSARSPQSESIGDIWKRLFRISAPLAISGASVTIYSLLDKLMLGYFEGASQVGIYSMARNLLETSLFPTFALVMTLRPILAGAWSEGDRERCRSVINRSVMNSIIYSSCVLVVFASLAGPLITGLFTSDFAESSRILILFLPLVLMRSIGSVILPGLIAADRADTYAKLTLLGAVANFILNIILIPPLGASGAVISTLISYLPIEILGLRSLAAAVPGFWSRRDWTRAVKVFAAALVTIALYRVVITRPESLFPTIMHAAALSLVYIVLLFLSRALTSVDIRDLAGPFVGGRRKA